MHGKVTMVMSKHTVCVDGMPRLVKDVRKQCSGVSRSSRGCLQPDDLRGQSSAIESGGVLFAILPHGDVGETGFAEKTNDQDKVPLRKKLMRLS